MTEWQDVAIWAPELTESQLDEVFAAVDGLRRSAAAKDSGLAFDMGDVTVALNIATSMTAFVTALAAGICQVLDRAKGKQSASPGLTAQLTIVLETDSETISVPVDRQTSQPQLPADPPRVTTVSRVSISLS